jgi:GNAT superfamily N-acetyltransferase
MGLNLPLSSPQPLNEDHKTKVFRCAETELNRWLQNRALRNQHSGASRCFVVVNQKQEVVGYYALATGSVLRESAPGVIRRNMPDPIPVVVLGRLAVDERRAGNGIGSGLLKDAILRTARLTQDVGIRALLCHTMSEQSRQFYLKQGFLESELDSTTLLYPLTGLLRMIL